MSVHQKKHVRVNEKIKARIAKWCELRASIPAAKTLAHELNIAVSTLDRVAMEWRQEHLSGKHQRHPALADSDDHGQVRAHEASARDGQG